MRFEKRKTKNKEEYYSFLYWDPKTKKRTRLRRSEVPADINNDEKAEAFCKVKEAELQTFSLKFKRDLEWKRKFYDFEQLLELYAKRRKAEAPNSWETDVYYLEQYVFMFFLTIKKTNNLNSWDLHFEDLRDWLEKDAELVKQKGKNTKLAYATKNACIKSLNRFLATMVRQQKMKGPAPRCQMFPKHQLNRKGIESYISGNEAELVYEKLVELDKEVAEFFWILLHTGLRLNEALGLAASHVFKGSPTEANLKKMLDRYTIKSMIHIILDSQPKKKHGFRDKDGTVSRKPMKHRRKIEPKNNRIIPVSDKRASKILAARFNSQTAILKKKVYGDDRGNYLLFDGLDKNRVSNKLRKAYELLGVKAKSPHDCRHTFCTELVSQTEGHHFLAKYVLGHSDIATTENYLHLWEVIQQKLRQNQQIDDSIDLEEISDED